MKRFQEEHIRQDEQTLIVSKPGFRAAAHPTGFVPWLWTRFILLGGIAFLLFWSMFGFMRPRNDRYLVLPGAAFATAGIVVMSSVFSRLIASSTRYSLVYGSLASLILLMLWLYLVFRIF